MAKRAIVVAGITVNVFSLDNPVEATDGTAAQKPVAILFLLHGRDMRADTIELVVKAFLDELNTRRKDGEQAAKEKHDLWIVTFDLPNHGQRMVDSLANKAWDKDPAKHNARHAIDMYAVQVGAGRDVSFLIDFLPSYLFPNNERTISQWLISGISLGGHATWRILKDEPRIQLGIPIIGCPDYLRLISDRAVQSSIPIEPPYFPKSFLEYLKKHDPANAPYTATDSTNPYRGKKILVLSGKEDTLVPWNASESFVEGLNVGEEEGGVKQFLVEPGIGHTCSPTMVKEAVAFLWDHALTNGDVPKL
ncbi:Alpha/Beta hydrolase protein [Dichomitus squalens]|uniref:Alpha/Beta hydrolase protein n=1 Tax=Dichomitus squalens TaxID=114155 RepID=A0A4Q9MGD6_9APHY|nr:Alpha/Beta hydrolase protein [Dichomitus squalens]